MVLLHGSFSTVGSNFSALVPALLAGGRCVYGVNYGNGGIAAVTSSAGQAAQLVTAVLLDTGATAVDVIAYSQGGLVLRTAPPVSRAAPLLQQLRRGGDLDGAVRYAEISTSSDIVVTPVSSQVPAGPSDRVRSVVVEHLCPTLVTDHVQLPAVRGVIAWAVAALDTDGRPPDTALTC